MEEYAKKITDEYNKWSERYEKAETIIEESVAAFMCNAIAAAVNRSSHKKVKEYFSINASY